MYVCMYAIQKIHHDHTSVMYEDKNIYTYLMENMTA